MERIPVAATDDRLLLMLYWKIYNDIDIPTDVIKAVLARGTKPESITRAKRRLRRD